MESIFNCSTTNEHRLISIFCLYSSNSTSPIPIFLSKFVWMVLEFTSNNRKWVACELTSLESMIKCLFSLITESWKLSTGQSLWKHFARGKTERFAQSRVARSSARLPSQFRGKWIFSECHIGTACWSVHSNYPAISIAWIAIWSKDCEFVQVIFTLNLHLLMWFHSTGHFVWQI